MEGSGGSRMRERRRKGWVRECACGRRQWACGRVGVWACGRVGVWVCGCVGVCGRVGVWACGRWACGRVGTPQGQKEGQRERPREELYCKPHRQREWVR